MRSFPFPAIRDRCRPRASGYDCPAVAARIGRIILDTVLAGGWAGFLLLASCAQSPQQEWSGAVEVREGVPHLINPDTPLWGFDHQPLLQQDILGGPDGPQEAYMSEPVAVAFAPDGTCCVLDARDCRVLRFAADGTFLGSFGRSGGGPGEFQSPAAIVCLPDGRLVISDPGANRLSFFTTEGDYLDSVAPEVAPGMLVATRSGDLYQHSQGRSLGVSIQLGAGMVEAPSLIDVLAPDGTRRRGIGTMTEYDGIMLGQWMNRVLPALLPGDSLAVNYFGLDHIAVFSPDGTLARVVHRSLPFEPIEPIEDTVTTENADGTLSVAMRFEFDMLSTGFAVSPDGEYWAALVALTTVDRNRPEHPPGEEEEEEIEQEWGVDLFDSAGRWLARQNFGHHFPMAYLDWGPGGLYLINPQEDALVYRFAVVTP